MTERRGSRREPGTVPLLEQILTDLPARPGAACIGRWELYDAITDGTATLRQWAAAEALCRHCPRTTACPDSLATRAGVSSTDSSPHTRKVTA